MIVKQCKTRVFYIIIRRKYGCLQVINVFYFSKKVRLFSQNNVLFLFYFLINLTMTTVNRSMSVADPGFFRGADSKVEHEKSYYLVNFFSKTCMKMKEIGPRGARVSLTPPPPPGSANVCCRSLFLMLRCCRIFLSERNETGCNTKITRCSDSKSSKPKKIKNFETPMTCKYHALSTSHLRMEHSTSDINLISFITSRGTIVHATLYNLEFFF